MRKAAIIFFCFVLSFSAWLGAAPDDGAPHSLDELIHMALQNSYLLQANQKQSSIIEAELDIIKTDYLPLFSAQASASYWKFLLPNKQKLLGDTRSDVYTDFTAHLNLYDGGQAFIQRKMVAEELGVNESQQRRIQQQITWQVTDLYFEWIKSQARLEVLQSSLQQLEAHQRYAENLYNIGKVSRMDVLRVALSIAKERKSLQSAEAQRLAMEIRIKSRCGIEDNRPLRLIDANSRWYDLYKARWFDEDSLYSFTLLHHPSLLALDGQMNIELKRQDLLRRTNRPEVYSFAITSWEDGYLPYGNNFNYNIGFGLRYTFPYAGGREFKIRSQQSMLRANQWADEKNETLLDLKNDIKVTLNDFDRFKIDIVQNLEIEQIARETYENAALKYQNGQGVIIDILDAQAALSQAETSYRESVAAYLQSIARLHYLTGNDVNPFTARP